MISQYKLSNNKHTKEHEHTLQQSVTVHLWTRQSEALSSDFSYVIYLFISLVVL